MAVTIGIDPHKGSHTAVALDEHETELGQLRVRSGPEQLARLVEWANAWPERTWAVENASGLGYLLSQQLVGTGEEVLDVPPKLAARARLLDNGDVNKNDPNDARSVAVAALRAKQRLSEVTKEDHAAVMRLWARRRKDLTSARTRAANRLHAVILELVPGGYIGEIYASKVARLLEAFEPVGAIAAARKELAEELLGDLRRLDAQLAELKERLAAVVAASGTTTTKVFGVGPVVAAITVGLTRDVRRFPDKDHFAAYNGSAPIEVSSGAKKIYRLSMRGSRQLNHALHMAAVTQVRHRHSEGRAYYDRKAAEGKTRKEALRALKRRISDALFAAMVADARRADKELGAGGPGGQTGSGSVACAAGSHPAKPALRPSHSRANPKARPSGQAARSLGRREVQKEIRKAS
ncbi:MAG TPA: IS110 family transposase [Acidimicrobiales bacterium]|nr:IS110 family transposase [Acidimicrobiales bacterium]